MNEKLTRRSFDREFTGVELEQKKSVQWPCITSPDV